MNSRILKKTILELLQKESLGEIFQKISEYPEHAILPSLFTGLCSIQERVRWNAVSCFGRIVPSLAKNDLESARIVMRRFLWSLNDESGGIGWGAPEAMAEVMCHCTPLRQEYLHMLISYMREDGSERFQEGNYLELPMLQRGLLWGVGKLCMVHRSEMKRQQIASDLAAYLNSPDIHVVGLAIWCLGLLGSSSKKQQITSFIDNKGKISLFIDGVIQDVTVGQLAEDALKYVL